MDRDQLRIEALKLAHLDIYPGINGNPAAVIERARVYAGYLLAEHDTEQVRIDFRPNVYFPAKSPTTGC